MPEALQYYQRFFVPLGAPIENGLGRMRQPCHRHLAGTAGQATLDPDILTLRLESSSCMVLRLLYEVTI